MLVLSRKEGESIILVLTSGKRIRICLTEYAGQQTRIGIQAPDDVSILRGELAGNNDPH